MRVDDFLAKTSPEQTIKEHTDILEKCFHDLMGYYGEHFSELEKNAILIALRYHDYGKVNYPFQNKLLKDLKRPPLVNPELAGFYQDREIPHGYLSPAFLPYDELRNIFDKTWITAITNAIYYHHTRQECTDREIKEALETDIYPQFSDDYPISVNYTSRIFHRNAVINSDNPLELWEKYLIVKGILNRLDYVASSNDPLIELDPLQNNQTYSKITESILTSKWNLRPVQEVMKNHPDENMIVIEIGRAHV